MERFFSKFPVFLFVVVLFTSSVAAQSTGARESKLPKNIILIIGDGMGVTHLTAAKYKKGNLALEKFTTAGLITTHSEDAFATDSAAAGTAMATGEKTCNYRVGVDCSGKPIKTVLEWAEEKKMSTGIIGTAPVTDATPAAFIAHLENRFRQTQIADQIADSGIDILFGGGWSQFVPKSRDGSRRNDEKDLLELLKSQMEVAETPDEFENLGNEKPAVALLAPTYLDEVPKRQPTLAAMVQKALAILSKNQNGFFLLVEGAQIDLRSHDNESEAAIDEVMDLDDAVNTAFNFASQDGETLIVVTADHETGGFALHQGSVKDKSITETAFTSISHTAAMVPLFAFGPGEETFSGIHDNTLIGKTLINYVRKESGELAIEP